ncbi:hypothetical protein RBH29_07920 [Herbivorax sp. ANBcel31]|uniref:hypothetical protein n=1 Tax=Herbivorax sp. ANBcel31 TaxID=3069754 RepID=UPI0027B7F205|nr:hypothetical protein [Herbivorax sp. ANBcel31]MDQ2086354.1 hypothetical protein [Herbivorax sp. ANBcel31]
MTFLKDITKRVSNSAKVAAKKSGNMVEATKLGLNINTEEEKIQKAYAKIGERIYNLYESEETVDNEYKEVCEEIMKYKENIQSMKDKILLLKNIKICPECDAELECKDAYCNMCGAKQEIPEVCFETTEEEIIEGDTFEEEEKKTEAINEEVNEERAAEENNFEEEDNKTEIIKEETTEEKPIEAGENGMEEIKK